MSKKEDYITHYNNYVWVNNKVYIKCPKCGKVALVDTGVVLTSYPPQYGWHCKYCNTGSSMFTSELYDGTYEQVEPSQEDRDLYEPPVKWSQESISINEKGITEESTATYTMDNTGAISIEMAKNEPIHIADHEVKAYSKCEVCGTEFEIPTVYRSIYNGLHESPRHICDDCAEKLRKLIGK
ncbi:MAG: hypothetical protein J6Z11_14930 [Candidatus Riflebacteria bacterium]|nr:hypothetical protein [Candidatus Riflebacteria bacterium]